MESKCLLFVDAFIGRRRWNILVLMDLLDKKKKSDFTIFDRSESIKGKLTDFDLWPVHLSYWKIKTSQSVISHSIQIFQAPTSSD